MAALNQDETERLTAVQMVLEVIMVHGYNPESDDAEDLAKGKAIKNARDSLRGVIHMKGYYPS